MKKRVFSALMCVALVLSLTTPVYAGVAWRLTGSTLVFTGDGGTDYTSGSTGYALELWKKGTAGRAAGVELKEGMTYVHDAAFSDMTMLAKVTMADTVTSVGRHAFNNCPELSDVRIPAKLTFLGEYAFRNCISLKQIKLPQTLTRVEQGTFYGCSRLTDLELGSGVASIGRQAFMGCTRLSVFAVPEKVKRLHSETFAYCTGLVQVYLPAGLERVDADAFSNCASLTDIYYGGTREQWQKITVEDGALKSSSLTVHYNAKASDLDENAQGTGSVGLLFDDVLPDYWGYNSVMTIAKHGLVTGTRAPDATGVGSFSPEGKVTLGQFLVVVTRLVCPEARRETPGHWARSSYNAAVETGIIDSKQFNSSDSALDAPLNRQNMAYILVRAAGRKGETFTVHPDAQGSIRDFGRIQENRREDVLKCYSNGIISGYGDKSFGPDTTMTRAQMAVVVCRLAGWQSRAEVSF